MSNPNVYPVATDMTEQFASIVEAQPPVHEAASVPVVGELENVRTFDPKDLPEGALLIPQDTTNPRLPRIGEGAPEDTFSGARGKISIDPNSAAMNMLHVEDPQGNRHRIFLSRDGLTPAAVIRWFVETKGYEISPTAIDFGSGETSPRHALREDSTSQEGPLTQPGIVIDSAIHQNSQIAQTPTNAPERHWFEPFQATPYSETDTAVSDSHFPSIREALAGEEVTAEIASEPIPVKPAAPKKVEPGDWRLAAQRKAEETFQDQPLPLGEQLAGIDDALFVVRSLLVQEYHLTREQVDAATEAVKDPNRWLALFPEPESFRETPTPLFQPFTEETRNTINIALQAAEERRMHGPLTEEQSNNARFAARHRKLNEIGTLVAAIKKNPTILTYTELEKTKPRIEPVTDEVSNDPPKTPPSDTLVLPTDPFNSVQPTTVIKPPLTVRIRSWAAQKQASFAKLTSKFRGRGKRQVVSA